MEIQLRKRNEADQTFIEDMLVQAIFVADGTLPDRSIIQDPKLYRYVDAWKAEDLCIIAEVDGKPVGACWLKWFDKTKPGYGYVRDDVPELSIAVDPEYRGLGLGSMLIRAIFAQLPDRASGISLSVDVRNKAMVLYERLGFVLVRQKEHTAVMLWKK